jgi:hypothetical protein
VPKWKSGTGNAGANTGGGGGAVNNVVEDLALSGVIMIAVHAINQEISHLYSLGNEIADRLMEAKNRLEWYWFPNFK